MANDKVIALTATSERPASTSSGYAMLIVLLLAILADVYGIQQLGAYGGGLFGLVTVVVATIVFILVMPGFYMLQQNKAAAIAWQACCSTCAAASSMPSGNPSTN